MKCPLLKEDGRTPEIYGLIEFFKGLRARLVSTSSHTRSRFFLASLFETSVSVQKQLSHVSLRQHHELARGKQKYFFRAEKESIDSMKHLEKIQYFSSFWDDIFVCAVLFYPISNSSSF